MSNIDDLSNEIAKQLAIYTKDVEKEVKKAADDVTKSAVAELKSTSPKKTGGYAKGWTRKKVNGGFIIHNKTDYQLTHLLEHGHVKVGGGRVSGKAHIRPVEEKAIKSFTEQVEKAIKQ